MNKTTFKLLVLMCAYLPMQAQEIVKLYPNKAPGSENWNWTEKSIKAPDSQNTITYNVVEPTLSVYLPLKYKSTGTAVLIAPGGAFHILSMDSEGHDVAKKLQARGVAAFVLKYRTVHVLTDNPFAEVRAKMGDFKKLDQDNAPVVELAIKDAQEALKHIRTNAAKYDIEPSRVGMMGFSAGGTLTLGAQYASDKETQPNFIAPIYPYTPAVDYIKNIPKHKTPIFIALASDDQLGFAPANAQLYLDWKAAGQAAEIHIYEKGGHGFGMNVQNIPTDNWHERFTDWMKMQGYLKKRYPRDWEKPFTEEQLEKIAKDNAERERRDWTNLGKYAAANKTVKSSKKPKAVLIGDSITEGWVRDNPDFFTNQNYVGRGISGQTSPQVLLRFRQDVVDLKAKIVLINIGINDVAENTGEYKPEFTVGNIRSMIEIAKANKIKVIIGSVLPAAEFPWRTEIKDVAAKVIALNAALKALSVEYKVTYLDYFSTLKNDQNGLSPDMAADGVHPTKKCYQIMEKMAKTAIEAEGGK